MCGQRIIIGLCSIFLLASIEVFAQPPIDENGNFIHLQNKSRKEAHSRTVARITSDCSDPTSSELLDINNVRAIILGGNDMWWDLTQPMYQIPKVKDPNEPSRSSLWAGSVWVGGIDAGKVLKVAAQTYRQAQGLSVGFWPGPLINSQGNTNAATCAAYNKHWKVDRLEIEKHKANTVEIAPGEFRLKEGYTPPRTFVEWPAHPEPSLRHPSDVLAPFVDLDDDGVYDPQNGDYPDILGDQSIWFVTNDAGNVAGSGSDPIGMEIQTQAFGYVSNDELNNMTFYSNTIINRSSLRLDSCFMSQWVDPALGWGFDDYIAVDVPRGLGIAFNGDEFDDGLTGYGENPPSVGVDFFEGPFSDPNDGIDNDRDCLVDEIDIFGCDEVAKTERMIMSKFMYFINGAPFPLRDPANSVEAYNFMTGKWADGIPLTYGGNGRSGTVVSEMAFPGTSDSEVGWSTLGDCQNPQPGLSEWSEFAEGNAPGDRRFVQSGGPFTLEPGAVNFITIGVVWARTTSGGPRGSFNLLLQADTKAQALFENCFQVLQGPDAPSLDIVELDQSLIINLFNEESSNNYRSQYDEIDPVIKALNASDTSLKYDETYNFQGYLLYQLADPNVSTGELDNPDRARLIFQCDLKDDIERIINYETDLELGIEIPSAHPDIVNNNGIQTSIIIKQDAFTTLNLVNNRPYHFLAIAYAHNNYRSYDPTTRAGNPTPYLAGRRNVITYSAIPHKLEPEFGGLVLNSAYGDGVPVKRLEGKGNEKRIIGFTPETENKILEPPYYVEDPVYAPGAAPFDLKIIDPKSLKLIEDFELQLYQQDPGMDIPLDTNARWFLTFNNGKDSIFSDSTLLFDAEQVLQYENENLGLSLRVQAAKDPGDPSDNNGFTGASISFEDKGSAWLRFLQDTDNPGTEINWIRAGQPNNENLIEGDPNEVFEQVLDGAWSPYRFVTWREHGPALAGLVPTQRPLSSQTNQLNSVHSVDLVITPDMSKWSRCVVLESSENSTLSQGAQLRNRIRVHPSIDKNGRDISNGTNDVGLGWFPGYAIDLNTGERLNISFAEESSDPANNGADLFWNPTDSLEIGPSFTGGIIENWGGRHHIYIMKTLYDEGVSYQKALTKNGATPYIPNSLDGDLRRFYNEVMWVSMPALNPGFKFLESELRISIRMGAAYGKGKYSVPDQSNFGLPRYRFSTKGLTADKQVRDVALSALDMIRVVPNPYYAYSDQENNQLEFRVNITNLPRNCIIRIYDLRGTLIRTIPKDDASTFITWDLKNQVRVPIAGGTYIIHVDAGPLGEKSLKWFGVLRPVDFDVF